LIAKDDQILFEGYQYGRTGRDLLTSQSMAKSITAMLMGIAFSQHALDSVSDPAAKYVPELKNSDYGKVPIRDLLHMSSGMSCNEPPAGFETIDGKVLENDCKQSAMPGTKFKYSAADSQLLGLILTKAVKMPISRYLDEKIWRNIGTESKATWNLDSSGHETAYCCFNAVLRDYARLGRLLAFDGAWNGNQIIPKQWLLDATTVKDPDSQLAPGKSVPFFGQRIFVDPESKLVMAQTAVTLNEVDRKTDAEMIGLWLSLVRRFGNG